MSRPSAIPNKTTLRHCCPLYRLPHHPNPSSSYLILESKLLPYHSICYHYVTDWPHATNYLITCWSTYCNHALPRPSVNPTHQRYVIVASRTISSAPPSNHVHLNLTIRNQRVEWTDHRQWLFCCSQTPRMHSTGGTFGFRYQSTTDKRSNPPHYTYIWPRLCMKTIGGLESGNEILGGSINIDEATVFHSLYARYCWYMTWNHLQQPQSSQITTPNPEHWPKLFSWRPSLQRYLGRRWQKPQSVLDNRWGPNNYRFERIQHAEYNQIAKIQSSE